MEQVDNKQPQPQSVHKLPLPLIIAIIMVISLAVTALLFFTTLGKKAPLSRAPQPKKAQAAIHPHFDLAHAVVAKINPQQDTLVQVIDIHNVIITLEIPKGALPTQTIRAIPYLYDPKIDSPGLQITSDTGPLSLKIPLTLSFDLSRSSLINNAPKTVNTALVRTTGKSQVLLMNEKTSLATPMLVIRSSETGKFVAARIISAGNYMLTLDGKNQITNARKALDATETNSLVVLESASTLLFNNKKLSSVERKRVTITVEQILANQNVSPIEYFAASALQKQILQKTSLNFSIRQAYAAESSQGYLEYKCKLRNLGIQEYLSAAKTADLLGYAGIKDACLTAATNLVVKNSKAVLNDRFATVQEVLSAARDADLFGLEDLSAPLKEKAKHLVDLQAQDVLNNADVSSPAEIARALAKEQALGNDTRTAQQLESKLEDVAKNGTVPPAEKVDPNDLAGPKDIVPPEFDQAIIGLEMAKAFGLESFDSQGIRNLTQKYEAYGEEAKKFSVALCDVLHTSEFQQELQVLSEGAGSEMGSLSQQVNENCNNVGGKMDDLIRELHTKGEEAADEVGSVQSQDYQTPDYSPQDQPSLDTIEQDNVDLQMDISETPAPDAAEPTSTLEETTEIPSPAEIQTDNNDNTAPDNAPGLDESTGSSQDNVNDTTNEDSKP